MSLFVCVVSIFFELWILDCVVGFVGVSYCVLVVLVFVIMSLEENGFSEYFAVVMTPIELISTNSVTSRSSFCLFGWAIFSDVEGG